MNIKLEQRGTTMGKLFSARKRRTERGTTPWFRRPSSNHTAYGRILAGKSIERARRDRKRVRASEESDKELFQALKRRTELGTPPWCQRPSRDHTTLGGF